MPPGSTSDARGDPGRPVEGQGLSAAASALGGWRGIAFDEIRIGDEWAVRDFTVEAEDVRRFDACLGIAERRDGPLRVPVFLLNEFRTIKGRIVLPPGVLHASEEVEVQRPVMTGSALRAAVRVKDAVIRNGKRFVVLEQEVCEAGRDDPALCITRTLFWPC